MISDRILESFQIFLYLTPHIGYIPELMITTYALVTIHLLPLFALTLAGIWKECLITTKIISIIVTVNFDLSIHDCISTNSVHFALYYHATLSPSWVMFLTLQMYVVSLDLYCVGFRINFPIHWLMPRGFCKFYLKKRSWFVTRIQRYIIGM